MLCAKLEIAKRERDEREAAAQLRRQVRDSVKKVDHTQQDSERKRYSTASVLSVKDHSNWFTSTSQTQQHFWLNGERSSPKLQQSTGDIEVTEHERNHTLSPLHDENSMNGEEDYFSQQRRKNKTKRRSFAMLKDLALGSPEAAGQVVNCNDDRPADTAKRRSQTVPLLNSNFLSIKRSSYFAPERAEVPPPPYRKRSQTPETSGFTNEYTISFDTCDVKRELGRRDDYMERPRPQPNQRPSWVRGEGMRSLLNLSQMIKKDKKEKSSQEVEEINDSWQYDAPPPVRLHARSQTAPVTLTTGSKPATEVKEKPKKRRTLGGFIQAVLLPQNHSVSHHQLAI